MQLSSYLLWLLLACAIKYELSLRSCCSATELHEYELNLARLYSATCNQEYGLFSKFVDCHAFRLQLEPAYRSAALMQCWVENHIIVKHYRTVFVAVLLSAAWLVRQRVRAPQVNK